MSDLIRKAHAKYHTSALVRIAVPVLLVALAMAGCSSSEEL